MSGGGNAVTPTVRFLSRLSSGRRGSVVSSVCRGEPVGSGYFFAVIKTELCICLSIILRLCIKPRPVNSKYCKIHCSVGLDSVVGPMETKELCHCWKLKSWSGSQCRGTDGNERVMSLMETKELCQVVNGHGTDRN